MKKVMLLTLLVLAALALFFLGYGIKKSSIKIELFTEKSNQNFRNVFPVEADKIIKRNFDNKNFIILDVRTPEEYNEGHIKNSKNIDFYSQDFKNNLSALDKNKTYLVYCRSGNRSGKALEIMKELKFMRAYNMLGGIVEWDKEGFPVVRQ
jgi:rhodanese-related sulfurtransferase